MKTYWLDTNVILRYLLADHRQHGLRARSLFKEAQQGRCILKIAPFIVAELVYVLESKSYSSAEIFEGLKALDGLRGVEFTSRRETFEALLEYRDKDVDFADALLMAFARSAGEAVVTFNKHHFKRLAGEWTEPR